MNDCPKIIIYILVYLCDIFKLLALNWAHGIDNEQSRFLRWKLYFCRVQQDQKVTGENMAFQDLERR